MTDKMHTNSAERFSKFTPLESEQICELWDEGLLVREIADRMHRDINQVRNRIRRLRVHGRILRRNSVDSERRTIQREQERLAAWDRAQEATIRPALATIARNTQLAKEGRLS